MATEAHEMESVSSIGKDDEPDFVPTFLTKKSRTGSVLDAVRSLGTAASKPVSSPESPRALRDCKLIVTPQLATDLHAHVSP